jgi:hypothetical protein
MNLVQPFKLTPQLKWPTRMPREGNLEVQFQTSLPVADKKIPLLDDCFEHIYGPNLSAEADVSDSFRATFCEVCLAALFPLRLLPVGLTSAEDCL